MSELKIHFERLMEFAKLHNFHKPFSDVYFVEENSIQRFYESGKADEIVRKNVFTFEDYENRFEKLLKCGHSWINMNLAGILSGNLLVVIELPDYENQSKFTSINLSLSASRVKENDWNLLPFIKII